MRHLLFLGLLALQASEPDAAFNRALLDFEKGTTVQTQSTWEATVEEAGRTTKKEGKSRLIIKASSYRIEEEITYDTGVRSEVISCQNGQVIQRVTTAPKSGEAPTVQTNEFKEIPGIPEYLKHAFPRYGTYNLCNDVNLSRSISVKGSIDSALKASRSLIDIKRQADETVGKSKCYVFSFKIAYTDEDIKSQDEGRVWLDAKTHMPVKIQREQKLDGKVSKYVEEFSLVDINKEVDDESFKVK